MLAWYVPHKAAPKVHGKVPVAHKVDDAQAPDVAGQPLLAHDELAILVLVDSASTSACTAT